MHRFDRCDRVARRRRSGWTARLAASLNVIQPVAGLAPGCASSGRTGRGRSHRADRLLLRHAGTRRRTPRRTGRAARGVLRVEQRPRRRPARPGSMNRSGTQLARLRLWVRRASSPVLSRSSRNSSTSGCHGLQVDAGGALAPAALVDRRDRGVERLQERHDAVGQAVGAPDQRAPAADPRTRRGRCRRRTSTAGPPGGSGRRSRRASSRGESSR